MRGGRLSYRRRRRVVALSSALVLGGAIAAAILLLPTGQPPDREPAGPPLPAASAQPPEVQSSRSTRISDADWRRIVSSLSLFVKTAVRRDHPGRSWVVVHPVLREGLTRRQWSTGNIPVVPFPVAEIGVVKLESVAGDTALLDIMLVPEAHTNLVRKTFTVELRRVPRAVGKHWLVSSWVPQGVSLSQMNRDARAQPGSANAYSPHHLSAMWILAPLGLLLGGIILIPSFVFARESFRARRAEARAHASAGSERFL
jgi:hypothetical protein